MYFDDNAREATEAERARRTIHNLTLQCAEEAYRHRKRARIWGRTYIIIGLPAAVLAAVAGVTALASTAGRIPAGIVAIVSAGLGSAAAFLDSQGRQAKHDRLANEFQALAIESGGFYEFEVFNEEWLKTRFPVEIVRLRKEYAALLKDQPLKGATE
jgi:hypothetical protein